MRIQDLHTFFVVARSGSMQAAADELRVTPGAISQRIRMIEEQSGKRLFSRSRKGIELTRAGDVLWQDVNSAFSTLEATQSRHFEGNTSTRIRISTAPAFALSVLVPRLGDFTDLHPSINISIETDERLVDLRSEPVDIALRHGLGSYPGLEASWLSSPELIVVASPELLARVGPIKTPMDCLRFSLLQNSSAIDWPLWFKAMGVDAGNARLGAAFREDSLIVKAATKGQGIALLNDTYAKEQLESGELIKALDATWPTEFAYYAVALPETFQRPVIKQFVDWLKTISAKSD